jgi:hypothetical protein
LEAVCVVDLPLNGFIPDGYGLVKIRGGVKKFAVIGFVCWEFGVIYKTRQRVESNVGKHITLKHADNTEKYVVLEDMFIHAMIVQHD